jgi:hypothetical protein
MGQTSNMDACTHIGRLRHRWEGNIKNDFELGLSSIQLASLYAFVHVVMNRRLS